MTGKILTRFRVTNSSYIEAFYFVSIRDFRTPSPANIPSIGSGSIFNIIAESFFLPAFSKEEVRGLLNQHTQDTGQVFSEEVLEFFLSLDENELLKIYNVHLFTI